MVRLLDGLVKKEIRYCKLFNCKFSNIEIVLLLLKKI